jgi:hypothetical protein
MNIKGWVEILNNYKPILCSIRGGICGPNNLCNSGSALADILIIKPFVLLLTVHFKLNLSIKTLAKRFNSSIVKDSVQRITARFVLS